VVLIYYSVNYLKHKIYLLIIMNKFIKIISTVPTFYFYKKLNYELSLIQSKKLASNFSAAFHAITTVILGSNYLLTKKYAYIMQINSGGWFLFDIYYLLKEKNFNLMNIMYLYHHISTYNYILLPESKYYWPYVMFYAELSNIPNYFVYYYIKKDKMKKLWKGYESKETKLFKKIQIIFYGFFRIFFVGYYGILELKRKGIIPIPVYMTSLLYIFGLLWYFSMIKRF